MTKVILLQFEGKINAINTIIESCAHFEKDQNISNQSLAEYYIYKGMLYVYEGLNEKAILLLEKGISYSSPESESLRTYSAYFKSQALSAIGGTENGLTYLNSILDTLSQNQLFSKARILIAKALLYKNINDFVNLEGILLKLIEICEVNNFYEVLGLAYYYQVELLYRQNRLEEIGDIFIRCYKLRYQIRITWFIYIWFIKALYHLKTDNPKQVRITLLELEEYTEELHNKEAILLLRFMKLEVFLQENRTEDIINLLNQYKFHELPPLRINRYYYPRITYLKVLLHKATKESFDEYTSMSKSIRNLANRSNNYDLSLHLKLTDCLAQWKQGNIENARQLIKEILAHTCRIKDILVYTEFGPEILEIIDKLPSEDKPIPHSLEIIKAFNSTNTQSNFVSQTQPTEVTLKNRDLRIMEMVSRGLKNEEIAKEMFLSPESIKKYLYNIYRELGVKNRIKASLKVKELGLLKEVK
jgi:DNA-binding CsgD family transcriptional regulator